MNEPTSGTYQYLLSHYGPLLTLKHVAELMHSTPNGVRMAICRKNHPFALALGNARRRLGRRVYFEARRVAEVIDRDSIESRTHPSLVEEDRPKHHTASDNFGESHRRVFGGTGR